MKVKLTEIEPFEVADSERDVVAAISESFTSQGQLQDIIVRSTNNPDLPYRVVFGRKRIAAALKVGWTEIDARIADDMSDEQAIEVGITENLHRQNLPWFLEAELIEQFHKLRQEQHGATTGKRGRPSNSMGKVWGLRDTAKELGIGLGPLSENINLADAVRNDPRLRNIKDKATAMKLVRIARRQAEIMAQTLDASPLEGFRGEVLCGSATEILKRVPDLSFDFVLTDPPWLRYSNAKLVADDETVPVFKELYRVMRHDTCLYMFVGFDDYAQYVRILPGFGFTVANTPAIWRKVGQGVTRGTRPWEFLRDYELILIAAKGNPVPSSSQATPSAFFDEKPVNPNKLVHPNQKPLSLLMRLIEHATFSGATILDPFGGSGATAIAAMGKNRHFTIIERDKRYADAIALRVKKAKAGKGDDFESESLESKMAETTPLPEGDDANP